VSGLPARFRVSEVNAHSHIFYDIRHARAFELCRLPQRPSLTLHPLGGSTTCLWPLFLLRARQKRKEMTGTQHVGALKHKFLQYITIKNVFVLFHYQNNFEMNYSSSIWWRHLPAACNNSFEAGVSGNRGLALS
jgi:hypothetical protein